jgi:peptidyl-prolyl cis-trans isomerase B (cyclophilin B)
MFAQLKALIAGTKRYDFPAETLAKIDAMRMHTSKGEIVVHLLSEVAPNTVSNFVHLNNQKFYDSLTFHRHEREFVIQGGCPVGDGSGNPSWKIAGEFHPNMPSHVRGTLSMAHSGKNTAGSQFFFVLEDSAYLDTDFTVFGQVDIGDQVSIDVMDSLRMGDTIVSIDILEKV